MDEDPEYQEVLTKLNSLITGRRRPMKGVWEWEHPLEAFFIYLQRVGLDRRLPDLNVIHVAGTKGKGSTCAMVESILREAGYSTGLFTSPHLWDVRERFRINGEPVSASIFLKEFWWAYNALEAEKTEDMKHPPYFRFLTLIALKIFLEERVDASILEVGIGGIIDATNCISKPHVCGISSLGFDHMELLGNTLPEIASHKAGILKPGVPAFTVPQRPDAMETLVARAAEVGAPLCLSPPLTEYSNGSEAREQLGLSGEHQRVNASLAVSLAGAFEQAQLGRGVEVPSAAAERVQQLAERRLPEAYIRGLRLCQWPGRGQVIQDYSTADPMSRGEADGPGLTFFLDGAHTPESMVICANWFADVAAPTAPPGTHPSPASIQNVLLFNCMEEREGLRLLRPLAQTMQERGVPLQHAIFAPTDSSYMSLAKGGNQDTRWQQALRDMWHSEFASAATLKADWTQIQVPAGLGALAPGQDSRQGMVIPSLKSAVEWIRTCAKHAPTVRVQVLVTGSLYLVGDMLRHVGKKA